MFYFFECTQKKFQLKIVPFCDEHFECDQNPWLVPLTGFVRVLENLESPGILSWHFPGLESPGKRPLVLESSGNLLNSAKNMRCMEGSKEN